MKYILFLISLLLSNLVFADNFELRLIHTNDLHAHLIPFSTDNKPCTYETCLGGFSRIKTFIDTKRQEKKNTLVLDAGDRFSGTIFYTLNKSKNISSLMRQMNYDAMAIGNHDFDDGLKELQKFNQAIQTHLLGANIIFPKKSKLKKSVLPALVFHKQNRQIGVIGITTPETKTTSANATNVGFINPQKVIQPLIQKMKQQGVNIIILLNHNGLIPDQKLAQSLNDIDVIISAHSHSLLSNNDEKDVIAPYPLVIKNPQQKDVLIVSTGMGGQHVGLLDLVFDDNGDILSYQGNSYLIDNTITPDPDFEKQIKSIEKKIQNQLNKPIFNNTQELTLSANKTFCSQSCYVGEVLTTALLKGAQKQNKDVKIAFLNAGAIRSNIPKGDVTFQHIAQSLPFESNMVITAMTGQEIIDYLNHGIQNYQENDRTNELIQVAGLTYQFNKKGVLSVQINQQEIQKQETYFVVMPSFLAKGGDGFKVVKVILKDKKPIRSTILNELKTLDIPAFENRVRYQN